MYSEQIKFTELTNIVKTIEELTKRADALNTEIQEEAIRKQEEVVRKQEEEVRKQEEIQRQQRLAELAAKHKQWKAERYCSVCDREYGDRWALANHCTTLKHRTKVWESQKPTK